ncbi:MAG: SDR family NAD(P)-dependent oxidoreductase [Thermoplasmata archaeon]|nr:SDR family NAD(P)-dependent oxidoreductase [Thermoplasmata archaeon]
MPESEAPAAPAALDGRVCVLSGATGGLGRATARGLAGLGARVVLLARSAEKGSALVSSIRAELPEARLELLVVGDLANLEDSAATADRLLERYSRIDVLVHNAGAIFSRREITTNGFERTFALNVLSPFVLTCRLARRLVESAPARVVNVASAAHRMRTVPWETLADRRPYRPLGAYGESKLELILLTHEFARRFAGTGVTVNSLHPGLVRSGFGRNNPGGLGRVLGWTLSVVGRSPRIGARTSVYLASAPEVRGSTGEYFVRSRAHPSSAASYDPAAERRLFEECERLSGCRFSAQLGPEGS